MPIQLFLCCAVLYCTVLYCTVLYCTVLYCTVLYCTALYCTVLYRNSLHDRYPHLPFWIAPTPHRLIFFLSLICLLFSLQLQGEEAEQLEGSDEKIEESCRVSAKVRFLDDIEDMGERSDLTAIQVIAAYMYCIILYCIVLCCAIPLHFHFSLTTYCLPFFQFFISSLLFIFVDGLLYFKIF